VFHCQRGPAPHNHRCQSPPACVAPRRPRARCRAAQRRHRVLPARASPGSVLSVRAAEATAPNCHRGFNLGRSLRMSSRGPWSSGLLQHLLYFVRDPWPWGKPHEAAGLHHASRRRGGRMAARRVRAAMLLTAPDQLEEHRFFGGFFAAGWSDTPRVTTPPWAVEATEPVQGPAAARAAFPPLPAVTPSRETITRRGPFNETILPA